jgi:hypothetical protein
MDPELQSHDFEQSCVDAVPAEINQRYNGAVRRMTCLGQIRRMTRDYELWDGERRFLSPHGLRYSVCNSSCDASGRSRCRDLACSTKSLGSVERRGPGPCRSVSTRAQ